MGGKPKAILANQPFAGRDGGDQGYESDLGRGGPRYQPWPAVVPRRQRYSPTRRRRKPTHAKQVTTTRRFRSVSASRCARGDRAWSCVGTARPVRGACEFSREALRRGMRVRSWLPECRPVMRGRPGTCERVPRAVRKFQVRSRFPKKDQLVRAYRNTPGRLSRAFGKRLGVQSWLPEERRVMRRGRSACERVPQFFGTQLGL